MTDTDPDDTDDSPAAIARRRGRHWDPQPGDAEAIAAHLARQEGLPPGRVRLDDGTVVVEGFDALGEGDT